MTAYYIALPDGEGRWTGYAAADPRGECLLWVSPLAWPTAEESELAAMWGWERMRAEWLNQEAA